MMMMARDSEDSVGIQHPDYIDLLFNTENPYPPVDIDEGLFTFVNNDLSNEHSQPMTPHVDHARRVPGGNADDDVEDSDDDDLAFSNEVIDLNDEQELEERGFGDEEEVYIACESHKWKIDHTKGEHRLAGMWSSGQAG
jgi:hypothetical protein